MFLIEMQPCSLMMKKLIYVPKAIQLRPLNQFFMLFIFWLVNLFQKSTLLQVSLICYLAIIFKTDKKLLFITH